MNNTLSPTPKVAIIGGGIAGSTAALGLASHQLDTVLIEAGPSLVNGPPICHLHAGGNLYREIDDEQCLTLLRQSIDTLKLYPQCADYRPTLIAIPKRDPGTFEQLLPRLELLKSHYQTLVNESEDNRMIGDPANYYHVFEQADVETLLELPNPAVAKTPRDWLIPVVKKLDITQIKFPLILVEEYGLNVFRLAASATLASEQLSHCQVMTNTRVQAITRIDNQWQLTVNNNGDVSTINVDYLVNACGFKSGSIDDLIGCHEQRLVEFKAAYVTRWNEVEGHWPEVIFYGQRGTPNGMAQLTPYPNGYFQIHGMTKDITLFDDGLVSNDSDSSQPELPQGLASKIAQHQWPAEVANARTQKSIDFMAHFIPAFDSAQIGGIPLYGAQQIPGKDPDLRAADVDFSTPFYARSEIVKASSAIDATALIYNDICEKFSLELAPFSMPAINNTLIETDVAAKAVQLASERKYPTYLASRINEA